jgi:hypothetical protein
MLPPTIPEQGIMCRYKFNESHLQRQDEAVQSLQHYGRSTAALIAFSILEHFGAPERRIGNLSGVLTKFLRANIVRA